MYICWGQKPRGNENRQSEKKQKKTKVIKLLLVTFKVENNNLRLPVGVYKLAADSCLFHFERTLIGPAIL